MDLMQRRRELMMMGGEMKSYEVSNLTFDGSSSVVTPIKLFDYDKDFRIECEISEPQLQSGSVYDYIFAFWCGVNFKEISTSHSHLGLAQRYSSHSSWYWIDLRWAPRETPSDIGYSATSYAGLNFRKVVATKQGRVLSATFYDLNGNTLVSTTKNMTDALYPNDQYLTLGANGWIGQIVYIKVEIL